MKVICLLALILWLIVWVVCCVVCYWFGRMFVVDWCRDGVWWVILLLGYLMLSDSYFGLAVCLHCLIALLIDLCWF